MPKGQNFDAEREAREKSISDWQFGSFSQPAIVTIPITERNMWLPTGENQFDTITDFQDCASRSPVNHLEMLFSYHYAHNMQMGNKLWMEQEGYIVNGKVTFSKRFIANLSGTTHTGNSLKSPLEAIRTKGLIPESLLPQSDSLTWDEYYSPIPQDLLDLGKEFLTRFTVNYEQVQQVYFPDLLKDDMIGVAAYAWPDPVNGIYPKSTNAFNHAFLLFGIPDYQVFDNYDPYTKSIAPDYIFLSYGYRVYISSETTPTQSIQQNALFDWLTKKLSWIWGGQKLPMPSIPPEILPTSTMDKKGLLQKMCLAIKAHEGWYVGSRSYKNNNPGNARYSSVGYLPKYGVVKKDPQNFAIFQDYATGYMYLQNLILAKAGGAPNHNLYQFFAIYAPSNDNNNPKVYAETVAKAMGVDPTSWQMKNLL